VTIRTVLEYPDRRLRLKAAPVRAFDADLQRLIDDLVETLRATKGLGLAAPQLGDPRRVLVTAGSRDGSDPQEYVNPEILEHSLPALVEEGCLSVPGVVGNLVRATRLRVRARDRTGALFEHDLVDMDAVCLQHEMDHLSGRLFIDRLPLLRQIRTKAALLARARRDPAAATPSFDTD
jgi:peptide deformylase